MRSKTSKPLRVAGVAFVLAAAAVPAAQAQDEQFIPGYTDFPNALRLESDGSATSFTPGHSDFPNHLRVASVYDRAREHIGSDRPIVIAQASESRGLDWTDAGLGAGGAAGVILLATGVAVLLRRPVRRPALTG
jgi:hypothetical protein